MFMSITSYFSNENEVSFALTKKYDATIDTFTQGKQL